MEGREREGKRGREREGERGRERKRGRERSSEREREGPTNVGCLGASSNKHILPHPSEPFQKHNMTDAHLLVAINGLDVKQQTYETLFIMTF